MRAFSEALRVWSDDMLGIGQRLWVIDGNLLAFEVRLEWTGLEIGREGSSTKRESMWQRLHATNKSCLIARSLLLHVLSETW